MRDDLTDSLGDSVTDDVLIRLGFEKNGDTFKKENASCGPIYRLVVQPIMGCDGCWLSANGQKFDIRMPETVEELIRLCVALGVPVDCVSLS